MTLARVAELWHCRPSALLAVEDAMTALQIDMACAVVIWRAQEKSVSDQ